MIRYLDYYPSFRCLAGDCPDTCCAGWEILVDEKSEARYRALPGTLGEKLRANLTRDGEDACFRMTAEGRCPFLRADNLCELITEKGPEILCRICDTHPRFLEEYDGVQEITLSNSCPEAARLLLTDQPIRMAEEGEGGIAFPLRDELIALAQDKSRPLEDRIGAILARCVRPACRQDADAAWIRTKGSVRAIRGFAEAFEELEILTDEWRSILSEAGTQSAEDERDFRLAAAEDAQAFENLMIYFLFHYMPEAEECREALAGAKLCAACWLMVRAAAQVLWARDGRTWRREHLRRAASLFAREIEHDRENVEQLLDAMHGGFFRRQAFARAIRPVFLPQEY